MRVFSAVVFVLAGFIQCQYASSSEFSHCLESRSLNQCMLEDSVSIINNNTSRLQVYEAKSEPDSQGWSKCQYCSVGKDRRIVLFNVSSSTDIDIAWSLWGEFFHEIHNDQVKARSATVPVKPSLLMIKRPVFLIQMITYHMGHVLVDLLEQIYYAMIKTYGQVRKDALLVIDVANSEERNVLQEKLFLYHDTIGNQLLRTLSYLPLIAMDTFMALPNLEDFVFADLHIGLDNSLSFFHVGFQYQPCVMSLSDGNDETLKMSQRYREFSAYIREAVGSSTGSENVQVVSQNNASASKVVFVQRDKGGRLLLNLNATVEVAESMGLQHNVQDLAELVGAEQVVLFQEADILVCAAGTALHNMLLMRPNTAVIIMMQASWCEWSWMYANQAVLLHIRPFIYCADEQLIDVHPHRDVYNFHQWSRRFWMQGPRLTKAMNISVDVPQFSHLLTKAKKHVESGLNTTTAVYSSVKESSLMCPGGFQHNPQHYPTSRNDASAAPSNRMPIMEIYISSVRVQAVGFVTDSGETLKLNQISVTGEIGLQHHLRQDQYLLESLPHLSICVAIVSPAAVADEEHWCYPVYGLNYLSELRINVPENVYILHFWTQATPNGGKFRYSDIYFAVDCSLPNGGFDTLSTVLKSSSGFNFPPTEVLLDTSIIETLKDCAEDASVESCQPYLQRRPTTVSTLRDGFSNLYALQQSIVNKCRSLAVSVFNCGRATAHIFKSLIVKHLIAEAGLPEIQHFPTTKNLFVFLHIEKTGGTTVREFIMEAADRHSIPYFIPCHGGIHCVTLEIPASNDLLPETASSLKLEDVRVIAGHFFWGIWDTLPTCRVNEEVEPGTGDVTIASEGASAAVVDVADATMTLAEGSKRPPSAAQGKSKSHSQCSPSCLIMGRHPVDRAISYYYQRCYQLEHCIGHNRRINELTPMELEWVVIHERQAGHAADNTTIVVLDEGMENAACRSVAGLKATSGIIYTEGMEVKLPEPLEPEVTDLALANMQQCTVGILERWPETVEVLDLWFPWMDFTTDPKRRLMWLYSGKETKEDLRPELYEVLAKHNDCDMRLYEEMLKKFNLQMEIVQENKRMFVV